MSKLKSLNLIDYIIFAVLAIGCFLFFQEINLKNIGTGIIFFACAIVVYMIAAAIGMGKAKSRLCAYAFVTMPIAFYCQFILGQNEVFMLLFVLFGFYFWVKENDKLFILFFAIAFFFEAKVFPVFIVLLLLRRKELERIIINVVLFLMPTLVKLAINLMDAEYRGSLEFLDLGITGSVIRLGGYDVNLTIFVAVIVMCYAYIKTVDSKEDSVKWALYLIGLQMFAMFGMGSWEPQYLILMIPFITISAFMHRDTKIFMALDMLLMLFFVLYVVNEFAGSADALLFLNGIKGGEFDEFSLLDLLMKDVLILQDKGMILSFLSVLILAVVIFKHPKYQLTDMEAEVNKGTVGFMRARFIIGLLIFLAPAFLCYRAAVQPPFVTLYADEIYNDIGQMIDNRQQSEVFISTKGVLEGFDFCIGTYDKENCVNLTVKVVDATTEEVMFSEDIDVSGFDNAEWVSVDTKGLKLEPGKTYRLDFVCYDAEPDECITIYRTKDLAEQTHAYAFIDGQRQEYHLCLKILENYLQTGNAE